MKRFLSIVCAMCLILCALPVTAIAATSEERSGNTDVNYPHESLYIIDPNDENSVVTYMNTAYSIPTGTDNKVVKYNSNGTYFNSDIWQAVPMISQELIDRGYLEGGEACQAIDSVVTSSDSRLSMFGTDISGVYRSLDGGNHWQSCTIGLAAGGATGIAIDPKNADHVILVGCNTNNAISNGLYVTTNATNQCEWTKGLSASAISGTSKAILTHNDLRIQIVYDLNSYDATKGYCMTAYWSVEDEVITADSVQYPQQAMWRTTDGGFSWTKLENAVGTIYVDGVAQASSAFLAGAEMASYTVGGKFYMYAATANGFYLSTDGGKNWTETLNSYGVYANAVDVIETEVKNHDADAVGKVWITTNSAMYRSDDFGYTWSKVNGSNYPVYSSSSNGFTPRNISVSSLNSDNIMVTYHNLNGWLCYSNNGGKSWSKSTQNRGQQETWQPVSGVRPFGYWSNTYENTLYVYANGIWKSVDGGKTIKWSNSGYNAIIASGKWNFNVNNPNLVALSAQDYNGGFSTDGGKTWTYLKWAGNSWGGHTYGAYALSEKTIFVTVADEWSKPRYLWTTFDGGKTYENTGLQVEGLEAGMGALGNDNVAFMGEWRTDDGGKTWNKMEADSVTGSTGCMGVLAIDLTRGTLFGANGNRVIYSTDKGITWYQLANAGSNIDDIAYDHEGGKLYVTAKYTLYAGTVDFAQKDNVLTAVNYVESGNTAIAKTVAVDPNNPQVVYVGGNGEAAHSSYDLGGLYRSLDSGKTWTCLTRQVGDGRDMSPDGGKKALAIRVNPITSEPFVITGCRGVWKIEPPPQWYLDTLSGGDTTAKEPVDNNSNLANESKKDLMETGKYANYSGYTPKTVTLELVSRTAGVENGYFKVPDGVTIYVGDSIKLGCSYADNFKMPDGITYDNTMINTTPVKGAWANSLQACKDSSGAHVFDKSGYYTLYVIKASSAASGYAIVSFYVNDPYEGYTEISTEAEFKAIKNNLNGNYVLTEDISLSSWSTVAGTFNGVLYGNGHKISGLTAPIFTTNNGGVSHIDIDGAVATTNSSYIAYCKSTGKVAGTNSGTIKNCLVANAGVVANSNSGSISGCYYSGNKVVSSGSLADGDVNYSYTDITNSSQFGMLDDNWKVQSGKAPVLVVEYSYYTEQDFYDLFKDYRVENGYIYIDNVGVTVGSLIGGFKVEDATFGGADANGAAMALTDKVNTGDSLTMTWENNSASLKVVIVGDILGHGRITAAGYEILALHVLGYQPLEGAYQLAADLDGDGKIASADLLIYNHAIVGLANILG